METGIDNALFAMHVQNQHIRANTVGLAQVKGQITFRYGDTQTIGLSRLPVIDVASPALLRYHNWVINAPILGSTCDGIRDRDNMNARDSLRVVPSRYDLDLVRS